MSPISLLIMWLSSYVAARSFHYTMIFSLINQLGESGYKVDFKNFYIFPRLIDFVPMANIVSSLYLCGLYITRNNDFLEGLDLLDVIVEMTDAEIQAFNKKRSFPFLLKISFFPDVIKENDDIFINNVSNNDIVYEEPIKLLDDKRIDCLKNCVTSDNKNSNEIFYSTSLIKNNVLNKFEEKDFNISKDISRNLARSLIKYNGGEDFSIKLGILVKDVLSDVNEDRQNVLAGCTFVLYDMYEDALKNNDMITSNRIINMTREGIINISVDLFKNEVSSTLVDCEVFFDELRKMGYVISMGGNVIDPTYKNIFEKMALNSLIDLNITVKNIYKHRDNSLSNGSFENERIIKR